MSIQSRVSGLCVITLLAAAPLTGCAPLAVGAIGATAFGVADRRSVGTQAEDQRIQLLGTQRVKEVLDGSETAYAYVSAYNRRALLTGLAPDAASRDRAEQIVRAIDNVKSVTNEIAIGTPSSGASSARDTVTSARVRAALAEDKTIDSSGFKVVTEGGIVYLMGLVAPAEGQQISGVVSKVGGVNKVVTLFETLSEEDYKKIQAGRERADKPVSQRAN